MIKKTFSIYDFISISRCDVLFDLQKNQIHPIDSDPDLIPLLNQFCNTFDDLVIDSTFKKIKKLDILKIQKNITHPVALLAPKIEYKSFIFEPHILYIDHTSIDVYILSPAQYVSRYFTYILGLWKFGFDQLHIPISRYMSISLKDKRYTTDTFFKLKFENNRLLNTQNLIKKQYDYIHQTLLENKTHKPEIGKHCFKPSKCDYFKECWSIKSPNIFDLIEFSFQKKLDYFQDHISSFEDIKNNITNLSERQLIQIDAELNNEPYIDLNTLEKFLKKLIFPIQCLDIEVITNSTPLLDKYKIFEKVPFLFSVHTLAALDHEAVHKDFFTTIDELTLRKFAEGLVTNLNKDTSIIVYDAMLEKIIFDQLASIFPDLKNDLIKLKNNIVDISYLFKSLKVYIPGMLGKFSLKIIHGSINKTNNHKLLHVKSGSDALNNMKLYLQSNDAKKKTLEQELRDYCQMDTKALIDIIKFLFTHLN